MCSRGGVLYEVYVAGVTCTILTCVHHGVHSHVPRERDLGGAARSENHKPGSSDAITSRNTESDPVEDPTHTPGSETSGAVDGATGDDPNDGSRTGQGFDTVVGRIVVERGLVTADELDEALELAAKRRQMDPSLSVADVLVKEDMITRRQLDRVRGEYETDKNSQQIPGYTILRKLGSGAMATVFLARQLSLDRLVAIKVLPKRFSANASFIERFYREGRAAAKLNDANVVQAYDVGQAGDHHYFVMEYVDGETVFDAIKRDRRISEDEALRILRQVASALQHAHERGFIHRDIKPKNIMMASNGVVKLADLGLARALSDKELAESEAGRAYGTPFYISPEQIRGRVQIGPESDIYGLGSTMYHMVTGKVPFEGRSPSQVMHRHLKDDLVPPDHVNSKLSAGTAQIIEMMLEKRPSDRYGSASDLIQDIDLVLEGKRPLHAGSRIDLSTVAKSLSQDETVPPGLVVTRNDRSPAGRGGKSDSSFKILVVTILGLIALVLVLILVSR